MTDGRDERAADWTEHLRKGGATPWPAWVGLPPHPGGEAADRTHRLPGAAQLELLRRLNAEGPLPHRVDHILNRGGPGRGAVGLSLPWPPLAQAAPADEVLRVAVGVLCDLVAGIPPTPPARLPPRPRRPPRGVPTFALDGLPVTVAELRADLAASGVFEHRPGRRWTGRRGPAEPDLLVLVVGPLPESLRQVWSRRVQDGSRRSWPRFVAACARRDALPPSADHLDTVAQWVHRIGSDRIHVVTTTGLHDQVRTVLGTGPASRRRDLLLPGDPASLAPAQVDLLRRVNEVLPFVLGPEQRDEHRRRLVQLMSGVRVGPERVAVPALQRRWAQAAASEVAAGLARSGCTVHGGLDVLTATEVGEPVRIPAEDVLTAAVRMIHRVDAVVASGRGEAG